MRPNPFLQPQLTGFGANGPQQPIPRQQTGYFPSQQQQQALPQQQQSVPPQPPMPMGLQPQLTGFQNGGARGNPFLAFGTAGNGAAGWQR
jgi:hypothetical protein